MHSPFLTPLTDSRPGPAFLDRSCSGQASLHGETTFLSFFAFALSFLDPTLCLPVGQALPHWEQLLGT